MRGTVRGSMDVAVRGRWLRVYDQYIRACVCVYVDGGGVCVRVR